MLLPAKVTMQAIQGLMPLAIIKGGSTSTKMAAAEVSETMMSLMTDAATTRVMMSSAGSDTTLTRMGCSSDPSQRSTFRDWITAAMFRMLPTKTTDVQSMRVLKSFLSITLSTRADTWP